MKRDHPRKKPGRLLVVSTPIGNLQDITLRALEALRDADAIAAEDTRTTRKLLAHFRLRKPLTSFFSGNQAARTDRLLNRIEAGETIALVSEAGTPGISDPGAMLIQAAIEKGLTVEALPGPSAVLAALVVSGLPLRRFAYEGFLPSRPSARRKRLRALTAEERTMVFFESPHRLAKTLQDMVDLLGDRPAALVREQTKKFEELKRRNLSALRDAVQEERIRGECTLVVGGATARVTRGEAKGA